MTSLFFGHGGHMSCFVYQALLAQQLWKSKTLLLYSPRLTIKKNNFSMEFHWIWENATFEKLIFKKHWFWMMDSSNNLEKNTTIIYITNPTSKLIVKNIWKYHVSCSKGSQSGHLSTSCYILLESTLACTSRIQSMMSFVG